MGLGTRQFFSIRLTTWQQHCTIMHQITQPCPRSTPKLQLVSIHPTHNLWSHQILCSRHCPSLQPSFQTQDDTTDRTFSQLPRTRPPLRQLFHCHRPLHQVKMATVYCSESSSFLSVQAASPHKVNITMRYLAPTASGSWPGKATMKKMTSTKLGHIALKGISRSAFVQEFLEVHALANEYSAGVINGPPFKMSWTGR